MTDPTTSPADQALPAAAAAETVEVSDLDSFVRHLVGWHTSRKGVVEHLLQIPEGSEFQVGDGPEAKKVVISGDVLAGFKFGIEMALMQLGTLPFAVQLEEDDTSTDDVAVAG